MCDIFIDCPCTFLGRSEQFVHVDTQFSFVVAENTKSLQVSERYRPARAKDGKAREEADSSSTLWKLKSGKDKSGKASPNGEADQE